MLPVGSAPEEFAAFIQRGIAACKIVAARTNIFGEAFAAYDSGISQPRCTRICCPTTTAATTAAA